MFVSVQRPIGVWKAFLPPLKSTWPGFPAPAPAARSPALPSGSPNVRS